jgi:hypothetical protein
MTATIKVNRKMVTYNLTEMTVGSLLKASLIDRGFDGTCWIGQADSRVAMFYRSVSGQFELAL